MLQNIDFVCGSQGFWETQGKVNYAGLPPASPTLFDIAFRPGHGPHMAGGHPPQVITTCAAGGGGGESRPGRASGWRTVGISDRLASRNLLTLVSFELCDLHHQVRHQKIANEFRNTHEQLGNICHVLCNAMIDWNIMKYGL